MRRCVLAVAMVLSFAVPAMAAGPPAVTTNPATNITPQGATLNGTVNPNDRATRVHFDWGTTKKYGNTTPRQAIGEGTTPVPVSANIGGLKSSTRYHFRVVAVNSAGTRFGEDRSFKTAPPTTTPTFTPNPAVYGHPFAVSGQLVGTGAAGAQVTLFARAFPFTAPFTKLGNPVVSNADGTYSFSFLSVIATHQFQVRATTTPPITSPIATLTVVSEITFHTRTHVRKGHALLFAGSVAPVQDGLLVLIQKRSRSGSFHTVAHTALKHGSATRSVYSRHIRPSRSGTYRTVVQSAGGAVSPGTSPAKSIRVLR
jgi:hypothetical protein